MPRGKSSRKYQLTINNPLEHGWTHERIRENIQDFSGCVYWCLCDEVGENGTLHTHVYMAFRSEAEFSQVKRHFYEAHIEACRGTHRENRDYIRKEGKYRDTDKAETNRPETFEESGELPPESDRRTKQSEAILAMVQDGASNAEILRAYPSAMNHLPRIDQTRQTLLEERYRRQFRKQEVTYLYGKTGVGKTRGILEKHGYENVYRVTNYQHPFDGYKGEPVIVFDEFRSNLPLGDMLNYLDGYPLMLPSRYADKVACYTEVYLVSNIPLEKQYPNVQQEEPESWNAFKRRIHHCYELLSEEDIQRIFSEEVAGC